MIETACPVVLSFGNPIAPSHAFYFALLAYVGIALFSILMTVGLLWKARPEVKRQVLIAGSLACGVALAVGVFFSLR